MSKRSRRTSIGEQFAPRTIRMLRSPAWRVLSLSAHRLLDRIEIEMADHGGTDNGKLPVTYDDFERYGIHRHAISPAMREAVSLGFLQVTEPGRAGNAEWRKPNLFRLTYRHTAYDDPTNEWARVETDEHAKALAKTARAQQSSKKPNTSAEKRQMPVAEVATESSLLKVRKPPLRPAVRN